MWSADATTVSEMRVEVARFIADRDWDRYHSAVNVASAAAVEAGELLELFQWRRAADPVPDEVVRQAGSELADVLHFTLCLANALDAHLESDGRTFSQVMGADEGGPPPAAKEAAEEVMVGAAFVLMAARASRATKDLAAALEEGSAEDAMAVSIEFLLSALVRCALSLGLDLASELERKNRHNEERYPVGSRPDVGY